MLLEHLGGGDVRRVEIAGRDRFAEEDDPQGKLGFLAPEDFHGREVVSQRLGVGADPDRLAICLAIGLARLPDADRLRGTRQGARLRSGYVAEQAGGLEEAGGAQPLAGGQEPGQVVEEGSHTKVYRSSLMALCPRAKPLRARSRQAGRRSAQFSGSRARSIRKSSRTTASIPETPMQERASTGEATMGSPRTLKEVFTSRGQPVRWWKASSRAA